MGEDRRFANTARVQHDAFGLAIATLDPRGYRHEVDYDDATHRFPVAERCLLDHGKVLTFTAGYDQAAGTLAWFVDPAGRKTTFHNSPLLQLVSIVKPGDSDARPTATFEYAYGTPTSQVISRSRVQVGGADVLEKHHYYDGLGRELGLVEQAEDGKTLTSGLKVFGPNGRVVRELEPAFTKGFGLGAPAAGLPFTAHRYDALGRPRRTVLPDGSATETRYGPLAVEHWDAEDLDPRSPHVNTPRTERLNGRGIVQIDEFLGATILSTRLERDGLGRIRQVIDAARNTTTYDFDGLGRVRTLTHPDAGETTNAFDDAGNLLSRTDARGATVTSTYDGINRPLTETLTSATGHAEERIAYHYDAPSPRFPDDKLFAGELTWVEDAAGVEHYRHDDRDHLAEMFRDIDGKDYHLALEHDGLDRLARVTYPDGRELDYRYDARGLLHEVPGILNRIDYDERGLATRREYANGAVTSARYDVMDRLEALGTTIGGKAVQSLAIGYDRAGNVGTITDAVRATGALSATCTFGYDDLYRLHTATGPAGAWAHDFDTVGNWRTKSGVGRLPHILVGALAGGGAYLVKAAITKDFSVRGALAATGGGAVAGAVTAATAGVNLLVGSAAAGIAGGISQRGIETGSLSKAVAPRDIATDAAYGAAGAAAGKIVSKVAPKVIGAAKAAIARGKAVVRNSRLPCTSPLNLASPERTRHILNGDSTGGGTSGQQLRGKPLSLRVGLATRS